MAKITVVGGAVVVTSAVKLDDIKMIEKYRPAALVLTDEEGEPIFKVGTTNDTATINKYGVTFNSATHDDSKLATMTVGCLCDTGDNIKEIVADTIGVYVMTLNKLEDTLPAVISSIKAEKEAILSNITVI